MKKNLTIGIIVVLVALGIYYFNLPPKPTSYIMMKEILSSLGVRHIDLKEDSIGWALGRYETMDGKMIRMYRKGYTFTIENSIAENEQMEETWKATGQVDSRDIGARFGTALLGRGFEQDWNNSGDATFSSGLGYVKDRLGCVIKRQVLVDDSELAGDGPFPTRTTISCVDDVGIEEAKPKIVQATSTQ